MKLPLLLGAAALAFALPQELPTTISDEIALVSNMSTKDLDELSHRFGDDMFSVEEQLKIASSLHEQALADADPVVLRRFQAAFDAQIDPYHHLTDAVTTPTAIVTYLGVQAGNAAYQAARLGVSLVTEGDSVTSNEWIERGPNWECKEILFFWARGTLERGNMVRGDVSL